MAFIVIEMIILQRKRVDSSFKVQYEQLLSNFSVFVTIDLRAKCSCYEGSFTTFPLH